MEVGAAPNGGAPTLLFYRWSSFIHSANTGMARMQAMGERPSNAGSRR